MMRLLKRFRYTLTFLALFGLWMVLRPDPAAPLYELSGNTMGTGYRVQLTRFPDSLERRELANEIQSRLDRLDRELMSVYAEDSEISRFNRAPVDTFFPVSGEVLHVLRRARHFSELTGGYFDVTVAPLVEVWGFGAQRVDAQGPARIPEDGEIEALMEKVGYRHVQVSRNPPGLRKTAPVTVDLGGIAKGYAADALADYFDSLGLDSYFVEVGGELRIRGRKPDGESWVPAIERPEPGIREVYEVLSSREQSIGMAGSGDYRNFFEIDGTRYSHEIDPFTGRPVQHSLAAVYVIAETALAADALTTAFMTMGAEQGMELARREDLAAYFIRRTEERDTFEELVTPAFEQYLESEARP